MKQPKFKVGDSVYFIDTWDMDILADLNGVTESDISSHIYKGTIKRITPANYEPFAFIYTIDRDGNTDIDLDSTAEMCLSYNKLELEMVIIQLRIDRINAELSVWNDELKEANEVADCIRDMYNSEKEKKE